MMSMSRSNSKVTNTYSRTRMRPKALPCKDQIKINNFFSSSKTFIVEKTKPNAKDLTNGIHIDVNDASSEFITDSSSTIQENLKLPNGITSGCKVPSICTRSQSQKMRANLDLTEKSSKKEIKPETCIEVNDISLGNVPALSLSTTKGLKTPPISPIAKDADESTSSNSPTGSLTPHKIQALNEAKLRLDSPLSNSPVSKLKIISSRKLRFSKKISGAKRKLPNQNSLCVINTSNVKCKTDTTEKIIKPFMNGALKKNSKPAMRNSQIPQFFPIRRSHRKPKTTLLQEKEKQIEEKILNGKEEGLMVECFQSKGRGVKTTRHFRKGEMVVEYVGDLIDMKEAKEREKKYSLDTSKGCYMYYFTFQNAQYCIDATEETGYLGRLVNHSRNGNLATKTVEVNGRPHLILIAKKDIEPGTEILYDYGDRSKQSLEHHPWLAL